MDSVMIKMRNIYECLYNYTLHSKLILPSPFFFFAENSDMHSDFLSENNPSRISATFLHFEDGHFTTRICDI